MRESIVSPYETPLSAAVDFSGDISFNSDLNLHVWPLFMSIQFNVKMFVFICQKNWISEIFKNQFTKIVFIWKPVLG